MTHPFLESTAELERESALGEIEVATEALSHIRDANEAWKHASAAIESLTKRLARVNALRSLCGDLEERAEKMAANDTDHNGKAAE